MKLIADVAMSNGTDVEKIKTSKAGSQTVDEAIASSVATIGENMSLRRAAGLSVGKGAIGSYVHSSVSDGLGKIGVLVGLESSGNASELAALGRLVAMHVAAANPQAVDAAGLDPAVIAREKDVMADKSLEWVRARNAHSKAELEAIPTFAANKDRIRAILDSKDKIPTVWKLGPHLYNFWKDAQNPKGLLRRTSMDELPQLINVVKGQMSLIGPRPALPAEVAEYDEVEARRLAVERYSWDGIVATLVEQIEQLRTQTAVRS